LFCSQQDELPNIKSVYSACCRWLWMELFVQCPTHISLVNYSDFLVVADEFGLPRLYSRSPGKLSGPAGLTNIGCSLWIWLSVEGFSWSFRKSSAAWRASSVGLLLLELLLLLLLLLLVVVVAVAVVRGPGWPARWGKLEKATRVAIILGSWCCMTVSVRGVIHRTALRESEDRIIVYYERMDCCCLFWFWFWFWLGWWSLRLFYVNKLPQLDFANRLVFMMWEQRWGQKKMDTEGVFFLVSLLKWEQQQQQQQRRV